MTGPRGRMEGDPSRPGGAFSFGPELKDGVARFRFWAPAKDRVTLELKGSPPQDMSPSNGGWFELTTPCAPGALYRFHLGDDLAVPDPASRAQAGDVHGWSVVVDPSAYAWKNQTWKGRPWEETVLYELHVGLMGGFAGVAEKLEALAALGLTAVELMPIADFPGARNWGYDGVLPYAPASAYGTPESLKALVDQAHGLGLMVFLDVVYNHFGPDGNYLPLYAPDFFRNDDKTAWGGAIDFRQDAVRRYFTENAIYWLTEYRFDGLRFDAVHAIKDPDWLDEMAAAARAAVGPDRHVHLVLENDDNVASHLRLGFDAQWNDDMHHVLHVLLTGEASGYYADYADSPAERLARGLKEGFIYQGDPSPHRGGRPRGTPSADLAPSAFVNFLQNHDQIGNRAFGERLVSLAPQAALRAAVALLLTTPAVPLIFMGEDMGAQTPFLYFTDHNPALADAVREGRRNEFAAFASFSDPKARSRIPDPNQAETFAASRPQPGADGSAWTHLYKTLLNFRRTALVPRLKGARALDACAIGPKAVLAAWRLGDGAVLTVAANLGPDPAPLPTALEIAPAYALASGSSGPLEGFGVRVWIEADA